MTLNEAYEQEEHDPRSEHIYQYIAELDFNEGGDSLGLERGGDGDNGEQLLYLLDCYFANVIDKQRY